MDYEEFEKAVDTMGVLTRTSRKDLKQKYLKYFYLFFHTSWCY